MNTRRPQLSPSEVWICLRDTLRACAFGAPMRGRGAVVRAGGRAGVGPAAVERDAAGCGLRASAGTNLPSQWRMGWARRNYLRPRWMLSALVCLRFIYPAVRRRRQCAPRRQHQRTTPPEPAVPPPPTRQQLEDALRESRSFVRRARGSWLGWPFACVIPLRVKARLVMWRMRSAVSSCRVGAKRSSQLSSRTIASNSAPAAATRSRTDQGPGVLSRLPMPTERRARIGQSLTWQCYATDGLGPNLRS